MSLSTNQVAIIRMMIASNPTPGYMAQLAAMSDTEAAAAIVSYISLMLPQLQDAVIPQQQQIVNDQDTLSNTQAQITILQAVSPTTGI